MDLSLLGETGQQVFWSHVEKLAGDDSCWFWKGPIKKSDGRPLFNYAGLRFNARHVAWVLERADPGNPRALLSMCGQTGCVRPSHHRAMGMPAPCSRVRLSVRDDLEKRFWSRVEKLAGDDACWLWYGAKNSKDGVGHLKYQGHEVQAHRVGWFLQFGELAADVLLKNVCGRPGCVRWSHWRRYIPSVSFLDEHNDMRFIPGEECYAGT